MIDFKLNVWRLHPQSSRIVPAEKTLAGTANPAGVKFCAPYSKVNSLGFWLFPAVDIDIRWVGGKEFEHRLLEPFPATDHNIVSSLIRPADQVDIEKFCPSLQGRTKFSAGIVEPSVAQLWTGCIFQTPPGYCLHVRSPINCHRPGLRVMEGILETDWMQYDIWTNLIFDEPGKWIELRKNGFPPLAQLTPVRRECVEGDWAIGRDEIVNRNDAEAEQVFSYWLQYNHQKFGSGGKQFLADGRTKDATTFHKKRAEAMGKGFENMEPAKPKLEDIPKKRIKLVR